MVENSLTGVVIHQDGKLLYVNRLAAEQLGYKVEELLGTEYVNSRFPLSSSIRCSWHWPPQAFGLGAVTLGL